MSLTHRLVLNRWLHSRFGATSTDDLLDRYRSQIPGADGLTYADLRNKHRVLHVNQNYIQTLLTK